MYTHIYDHLPYCYLRGLGQDPGHYRDALHYDSSIATAMVEAMARKDHRILSVAEHIQMLKRTAEEAAAQLQADFAAAQCP